jgi:outer membrane protein
MQRIGILALLMIAAVTSGAAQEPRRLTIDEAISIGLENSKTLRISRSKVDYADAKLGEANASALPSITGNANYTRLSNVPPFAFVSPLLPGGSLVISPTLQNSYNVQLAAQHPLFMGFKIDAAKDAARASVDGAQEDFTKDRSDLVYNIRVAYWGLFRAQQFLTLANDNVAQMTSHLNDVKNLMAQGLATTNDTLAVVVQLSNSQLRQIDAANGVRLSRLVLNNVLGIPLDTDIEIASEVAHAPRHFAPLDSLITQGLDERPDVKSFQSHLHAAEAGVTAARSGWWPRIVLMGHYIYARPNSRIFPTVDAFKDTWDVGVNVSLDIWNWGTTIHQTDQASAQLAQAREGLAVAKDAVTLDITQASLSLKQASERISVATNGLAQAEENYRVTSKRFKEGLVINSDMLDAEYSLTTARINYTQALVDFELAQALLTKAIGE